MHLGHGHSLINPCRRSSEDPLHRVDFALRLQTHNGVPVPGEYAYVVSAGEGAVGQYRYEWHVGGVRHRNQLTGWYFTQVVDGVNDWWGLFDASDTLRGYGATPLAANPAEAAPYSVCGDPVSQLVPNYAPLGLYQDLACTVPATTEGHPIAAWRDELTPSGLTAVQAEGEFQPVLRFRNGFPTVEFDGVDDYLFVTSPWSFTECVLTAGYSDESVNKAYCVAEQQPSADTWWRETYTTPQIGSFGVFRGDRLSGYPAFMPKQPMVLSVASGVQYEVFIEGVSQGIQSGNFLAGSNLAIGSSGATNPVVLANKALDGWMVALVLSSHVSDRLSIEPYIQNLMPR